jgi:hypothetical protein
MTTIYTLVYTKDIYLISIFKFSIVIAFLLNSIVSQMNHPVSDIFQIELFAACSEIALSVPIPLEIAIHCGHKCVTSDIKLPAFVQQWLLDVFLNDVRPLLTIDISVRDYSSNGI